jgi:hypothetical protein
MRASLKNQPLRKIVNYFSAGIGQVYPVQVAFFGRIKTNVCLLQPSFLFKELENHNQA